MSTPVKINTPLPSVEETAHLAGVSSKRARELVAIARSKGVVYRSARTRLVRTAKKATPPRTRANGSKS